MWHSFPIWISERKLCKRFPRDFKVCGRSPNWPWSTLRAVCPSRVLSCLLFNSQQPGRFSLFSLFVFISLSFFFSCFRLYVLMSLYLFVPLYVPCSAVTKRVASKTALNELSRWVWWECGKRSSLKDSPILLKACVLYKQCDVYSSIEEDMTLLLLFIIIWEMFQLQIAIACFWGLRLQY